MHSIQNQNEETTTPHLWLSMEKITMQYMYIFILYMYLLNANSNMEYISDTYKQNVL